MRAVKIGAALSVAAMSVMATGVARVQGQSSSPSVRAAARLYKYPPPNWIRHYLPDDRYKLAGGTWKVVSTETDSFYYPAWAPEMLRQSNGIVIGFPSAAAAEEAGYKRSKYPMESPLLGLTGRPLPTPPPAAGGSPLGGLSLPSEGLKATVNKGQAQRVTLADGSSSTILPAGWTHLTQTFDAPQSTGRSVGLQVKVDFFGAGALTAADALKPGTRIIAFGFAQLPNGQSAQGFSNSMARLATMSRNGGSPITSRPGGFGDVRGIVIKAPVPNLGNVPIVYAGRGSKLYLLYDASGGARGSRDIIRGFRGR